MKINLRSLTVLAAAVFSAATFTACSSGSSEFCDGVTSVAGFTSRFSLGLDNFSESDYAQLRLDALDTYDVVMQAVKQSSDSADATRLSLVLKKFVAEMDKVSWDITRALGVPAAVEAAAELGNSENLVRANSVEAFVISQCGLPSTLPIDVVADTLPFPSIAPPLATEPPTNTLDQNSEYRATGVVLSSIYGVTVSDYEAECLGRQLDGVVDMSAISGDSTQYIQQFQKAFDACEVGFTIPSN